MKIAVSIYSFSQYIRAGKLTPVECIAKAKEMGFEAIEIVDFWFDVNNGMEIAKELRAEADRVGIEIPNLAIGADFLKEGEVERVCKMVDIAEVLGVKYMRHDVTGGPANRTWQGYDTVVEQLANAVRQVTEYAASKGIRTMTENHGFFSQDSLRVEKLINTVAHDNFGQLIDMGNFLCADEDPVLAVSRCAPYAFYVHAKDFIVKSGDGMDPGEGFFQSRGANYLRGTIIGHGQVPVVQCLRILKRAGYDGYLAIEFEGMEDCIQGIRIGYENLKKYVGMVYGA